MIYNLFNRRTTDRFRLTEPGGAFTSAKAKSGKDNLIEELKNKKTTIVSSIVEALAVSYDQTSIIDSQYNKERLGNFRTYYSLQKNSDNGVKEFKEELLALEDQYTSLVKHAKF